MGSEPSIELAGGFIAENDYSIGPGGETVPIQLPPPNGVDDSAIVQAVLNGISAGGGGNLLFGPGTYHLNNLIAGSLVARKGVGLTIGGAGSRRTFLMPTAACTGKLLTVLGPEDSSSEGFNMRGLTIGYDFEAAPGGVLYPQVDYPYTNPFLTLVGQIGAAFRDVVFRLPNAGQPEGLEQGTGTCLQLDCSFNLIFENVIFRTGRYGLPFIVTDSFPEGPVRQMDTLTFENVFCVGDYGPVFYHIKEGLSSLRFVGMKCVVEPTTDRNAYAEGTLNKTAKPGESTIELTAGDVAEMKIEAGASLAMDYGAAFEVNRVTKVAGNVLTLIQPLQFTHNPAEGPGHGMLRTGCVAGSISTNTQTNIYEGCHLEGHGTGILRDGTSGVDMTVLWRGGKYSTRTLFTLPGYIANLDVDATEALGHAGLAQNYVVEIPAFNTRIAKSRIAVRGPLERLTGAPAPVVLLDPGKNFQKQDLSGGYDELGLPGILAPRLAFPGNGAPFALNAVANEAFVMRIKAMRVYNFALAAFRLTVKAGAGTDTFDIGIYDASWNRLFHTGLIKFEELGPAGNAIGIVTTPFVFSLPNPGVYYVALGFGTITAVAAQVSGANLINILTAEFFGSSAGVIEADGHVESTPLPEKFVGGLGPAAVPVVALREA